MKISYGKLSVPIQRVVAHEDGRHDLLAAEVSIEVLGENFMAAYTEGDNSAVVATDTMKNFILSRSLAYDGDTLDGLLEHLGRGFLSTYPVMEAVRMSAKEHRFHRVSDRLFARGGDDHASRDRRARRRTASATAESARGPVAAQGHRQRVHPLRARREHDAPRARSTARSTSGWTSTGAQGTSQTRSKDARIEKLASGPSTTSCRSRSSTSSTGWARARWRAGRSSPRSPSPPQNHTRDPHGQEEGRKLYSDAVPRLRPDHPDDGARVIETTHVLDTAHGRPAAGIRIELARVGGEVLASATTNADGRTDGPLLEDSPAGEYQLTFTVGAYFGEGFLDSRADPLPRWTEAGAHYHVPLLVSPWSYSTYRGT